MVHMSPSPSRNYIPLSGSLDITITTESGSVYNLRVGRDDEWGLPVINLVSGNPKCPLLGSLVEVRIDGKIMEYLLSNMATGLRTLQLQDADASVQAAIGSAVQARLEQMFLGKKVQFVSTTDFTAWDITRPASINGIYFPTATQ